MCLLMGRMSCGYRMDCCMSILFTCSMFCWRLVCFWLSEQSIVESGVIEVFSHNCNIICDFSLVYSCANESMEPDIAWIRIYSYFILLTYQYVYNCPMFISFYNFLSQSLTIYMRMALDFWSSCLSSQIQGLTVVCITVHTVCSFYIFWCRYIWI